jgi:hypothetical protein
MKATFLALFLSLLLTLGASAAIIVSYDFQTGTTFNLTPDNVAANTGSSSIANGSFSMFQNQSAYASAPSLQVNPPVASSSTLALAIGTNSYFTFSVTADPGYKLNLTNLTFNAARGGASATRSWHLLSSIGGFTAANVISEATVTASRPTFAPYDVSLSGAQFQGLEGTTVFRMYVSTPSNGQSMEFDDFVLNGEVLPIPEPSAGGGVLVALAGLALVRRRRVA